SLVNSFVLDKVGKAEHRRTLAVHENLVSDRSWSLKVKLVTMPVENNHKIVLFEDADPKAFALYVQYLCTSHVPSKPTIGVDITEHTSLCNLCILANDLDDTDAQNAACDAIYAKSTEIVENTYDALPHCEHINLIYKRTSGPCEARRLLVDLYTLKANGE
ncbi:hypothetical protein EK21DRAFT_62224, partial [Setomelanomma holmii]